MFIRKVITDLTQQLSDSYNARKKGAVIAAKRIALINNNTGTVYYVIRTYKK